MRHAERFVATMGVVCVGAAVVSVLDHHASAARAGFVLGAVFIVFAPGPRRAGPSATSAETFHM